MKVVATLLEYIRRQTGCFAIDISYGLAEEPDTELGDDFCDPPKVLMGIVAYKGDKYVQLSVDLESLDPYNPYPDAKRIIEEIKMGLDSEYDMPEFLH